MTSRYESKLQIKNRGLQGLKLLVKESEILLILPMLITSEKMLINLTGWNTFWGEWLRPHLRQAWERRLRIENGLKTAEECVGDWAARCKKKLNSPVGFKYDTTGDIKSSITQN